MTTTRKGKAGSETKAVLYIRVSTDEQALGPVAQLDAAKRWAAAKGVELVSVHEDRGVSGGAELDRCPALLAAIDSIQAHGAGILLVTKRDRLARDVMKAAMVEHRVAKAGAKVMSCAGEGEGNDPASALMRTMVDAFAAYEKALIGQRTKAALQVKKARGEKLGGLVPTGWKVVQGGKLERNDDEQQLIERCRSMKAAGLKLDAIAANLTAEGVTLRGRPLYAMKVCRLLKVA